MVLSPIANKDTALTADEAGNESAAAAPTWLGYLMGVGRVITSGTLMSALFGGLCCLWYAERIRTNRLQLDDDALWHAGWVAIRFLPPFLMLSMMVESAMSLVPLNRRSWRASLVLGPVLFALIGAIIGWFIFQPVECQPKGTMLAAGGALAVFLGVSLHLSLWRMKLEEGEWDSDFPPAWYFLAILLGTTFFGGMTGWSGNSIEFKRLAEYRYWEWDHKPVEQIAPGEANEDYRVY